MLSGCSTTVPVVAKFPEAPETMLQGCPKLTKLKDDAKLSDVADLIVNTYTLYYECSTKHAGWIEWYNAQKTIFEEIK